MKLLRQLPPILKFALVGVVGYVFDAACFHFLIEIVGVIPGRIIAFLIAVSVTYFLNKRFTFEEIKDQSERSAYSKYLIANSTGGFINIALTIALVKSGLYPFNIGFVAVACGSVAGMFSNYFLSKTFVFRKRSRDHA